MKDQEKEIKRYMRENGLTREDATSLVYADAQKGKPSVSDSGKLSTAAQALHFIFAGNATFTLRSLATGVRYTYKITEADKKPGEDKPISFVGLLTGPENTADYTYIGIVRNGKFSITSKSRMGVNSAPVVAITWTLKSLQSGKFPSQLEIWHEGRCGRCGRKLTVPESVAAGIGPECAGKMGGF